MIQFHTSHTNTNSIQSKSHRQTDHFTSVRTYLSIEYDYVVVVVVAAAAGRIELNGDQLCVWYDMKSWLKQWMNELMNGERLKWLRAARAHFFIPLWFPPIVNRHALFKLRLFSYMIDSYFCRPEPRDLAIFFSMTAAGSKKRWRQFCFSRQLDRLVDLI